MTTAKRRAERERERRGAGRGGARRRGQREDPLAPGMLGELGGPEARERGRREAEADQPDGERAAGGVRVDRDGRAEHPFTQGDGGERADERADRTVSQDSAREACGALAPRPIRLAHRCSRGRRVRLNARPRGAKTPAKTPNW